ncbi:cupin domain-containing protein [Methylobacterium sp. NEAU 140]|uniref:cupin domain-containing protein n=1 Tax=Methylobacterium sp. NEAU 140 TaxID=3064945 RepID=UPI0027326209|nr:cupin domain-containing protein [Methylobacterium sp. NEAU 140]MDP4026567.1 cupin domain-containing protein [Methylobacterium sp. NEAU 140]
MEPVISHQGEGEVFELEPGSLVRFKVFSKDVDKVVEVYERELPPRTIGADPHLHATTIETFYVVSGTVDILCGQLKDRYNAGSIVVVPHNTVHAYDNSDDIPAKLLIFFCPGLGHEEFFRELAKLKRGPKDSYQHELDALRRHFDSTSVASE